MNRCPCCNEPWSLDQYGEEPPFCWGCGIYQGESAAKCDVDHATGQWKKEKDEPVRGLGC